MKKRIPTLICLIVCMSLFLMPCITCAASTSDAVEPISVSQNCSLTVTYAYNGTAFSDIPVSLYKIADVSSDFQYTPTDEFKAINLRLNGITSISEWNTIRTTSEAYIIANSIEADAVRSTDENGQVSFRNLTSGVYLVASVQCSNDGFRHCFASVLTALPDLNDDGTWNYDVNVTPKADADDSGEENSEYKVLKLWKDNGNVSERPNSIEVYILRNGEIVKTVILSEENNWSYTWYAEDDGSTWQVIEKNVPDGYVMTIEQHTTTFTIINSIPDESDTSPENPDVPKTGDSSGIELYVTLMCISGFALVLLGITGKRKAE